MKSRSCAFLALLLANVVQASEPTADPPTADPLRVFEERIMPIFNSPKPSSCVQCHLSSVDIKDYILPSHTDTFLALRADGLIDVEQPGESKILKLIGMGERDQDAMAKRIHAKARKAEYEAFSAWISACCADETLLAMSKTDLPTVGPEKPLEVVRHARKSRVVESFTRAVWSQRMRCFPCHTPNEIDPKNPKHKVAAKRHREFVQKYGAKMNLFAKTPEATMNQLIASSRKPKKDRYPLINLEDPAKSLLVLKPTAKVPKKISDGVFEEPSATDPVSHMGGLKMHTNDHSYKLWVSWLQDYANVAAGEYTDVEDLPQDNWIPTQRILRVSEIPEDWGDLTVVQFFVHTRASDSDGWSEQPIAFTQGLVTPRRMAMGALLLLGSNLDAPVSKDTFPLSPGQYLVKAFVDREGKVAESPAALLGESEYVGKMVIDATWKIGFPKAEKVSAANMVK